MIQKSKNKPSKGKSKPDENKRKPSVKSNTKKENLSTEDVDSIEEKVEKKPRGRPRKSPKPIAADIDTESNDEVIQSDELDGLESGVKSNSEVSENNDSSVKRGRYRRRTRKKNEDKPISSSLSPDEKSDLDFSNNLLGLEDDPKKQK